MAVLPLVAAAEVDAPDVAAQREEWRVGHQALVATTRARCFIVPRVGAEAGVGAAVVADGEVKRGRAAEFGSAVHALLERIDLARPDDAAAMSRTIAAEFGVIGQAAEIERVARAALASDIMREALGPVPDGACARRRSPSRCRSATACPPASPRGASTCCSRPAARVVVVSSTSRRSRVRCGPTSVRVLSNAGTRLRLGGAAGDGAARPRGRLHLRAAGPGRGALVPCHGRVPRRSRGTPEPAARERRTTRRIVRRH